MLLKRRSMPDVAVLLVRHQRLMGALTLLQGRAVEVGGVTFVGDMPVIDVLDCPGNCRFWGVEVVGACHDGLHRAVRKQVFIHGCKIQWSEHVG